MLSFDRGVGFVVAFLIALAGASTAQADLLINVAPPALSIAPGQTGRVMIQSQPQPGFPAETASAVEYTLVDFQPGSGYPASAAGPAFPPTEMTITVNPGTAPGNYPATIRAVLRDANGGEIGDKLFPNAVTVTVEAAGTFDVSLLKPSLDVTAGGEGRAIVIVNASGGFSKPVTIDFSVPGTSIRADTPRTSTPPRYDAQSLRISVPADVPAGTHMGTFSASDGTDTKTATLMINVAAATTVTGDYEVSITPNPIAISTGRETFTIDVRSVGGFSGAVQVRAAASGQVVVLDKSCPPGTFCPFTGTMLNVPAGGLASEQAIASSTGTSGGSITVMTAVQGMPERQTEARVTVAAPAPPAAAPSFTFTVPPSVDVKTGDELTLPLRLDGANGWSERVDVRIYSPPGITANPESFSLSAGETTPVQLRVAADAPPQGVLTVQAQATAGGQLLMKEFRTQVNVTKPGPVGRFELSLDADAIELAPGERKLITATVRSIDGFSGVVPYASSVPAGNDLHILDAGCPATAGPECVDRTSAFNVGAGGETQGRFFVLAGPNATNGKVLVALSPDGLPAQRAALRVNIKAAPVTPLELRATVTPERVVMKPGESRRITLRVEQVGGTPGELVAIHTNQRTLDLAAGGAAPASFNPDRPVLQPGVPQEVEITAPSYVTPGSTYRLQYQFAASTRSNPTPQEFSLQQELVLEIPAAAAATPLKLTIDPPSIQINPSGSPSTVRFTIERPAGLDVAASVRVVDGVQTVGLPTAIPFAAGETSKTIEIIASQATAGLGTQTARFEAQLDYPHGEHRAEATLSITPVPPASYVTVVEPNIVQLSPGEAKEVAVQAVGIRGWSGELSVTANNVEGIEPIAPFTVATGGSQRISIRATPAARLTNDLVLTLTFAPGKDGRPSYEEVIRLNIARPAAASVRVVPDSVSLLPGEQARVRVEVSGENGWSGPVDVAINGSSGITAEPATLLLTSLPGSADVTLTANANAATVNGAGLRVQVFPIGTRTTIAETVVRGEVRAAAVAFSVAVAPERLLIGLQQRSAKTVTVRIEPENGWSGPVDVEIGGSDKVDVNPSRFHAPSLPHEQTIEVSPRPDASPTAGFEPSLIVRVVPRGGSAPKEAAVALNIVERPGPGFGGGIGGGIGGGTGGGMGRPGEGDSGSEFPLPDTPFESFPGDAGPLPYLPQSASVAASVKSDNRHVDGLAAVIASHGSDVTPEAAAMLKFYEALLAEGQSMAGMLPRDEMDLSDPQLAADLLTELIEQQSQITDAALYRSAMIGGMPGLFTINLLDYDKSDLEDIKIEAKQPVNWATATNKVELLILQMKAAQSADRMQEDWTGPARENVGKLSDAVGSLDQMPGAEKLKLGEKMKVIVRPIAIAGAIFTVADIVARATAAFLPYTIKEFYAEVDNQHRVENDLIVPDIQKGKVAPIKVFILTKTKGGRIVSPSEVINYCFGKVTESQKFKDWFDKKAGGGKPGAGVSNAEIEKMKDEVRDEFLKKVEKVASRVAGLPPLKQWLESGWDVAPRDLPAIEVNSNRVLEMRSNSPSLLAIRQGAECGGERYCMVGLHKTGPGETAGYFFGLKRNLREGVLKVVPGGLKVNVKAVVEVKDEEQGALPCFVNGQKREPSPLAGQKCDITDEVSGEVYKNRGFRNCAGQCCNEFMTNCK